MSASATRSTVSVPGCCAWALTPASATTPASAAAMHVFFTLVFICFPCAVWSAGRPPSLAQFRIEHVTQGVAQRIEGQHDDEDQHAGQDRYMGSEEEEAAAFRRHGSQLGRG